MNVHYFYGGPFSQWVPCNFTDAVGVTYNSTEQYMMAHKALLMNDHDMYSKIMEANDPRTIKYAYGRNVKNFDQKLWDEHKFDIVYQGNLLKFSQNAYYRNYLINTGDTLIVEASPTDTIWGIGLSIEDAERGLDWRGENLLGKAIMKVREKMLA